ncbi:hypothetical protein CsatA_006919 [Cannabis sativa]
MVNGLEARRGFVFEAEKGVQAAVLVVDLSSIIFFCYEISVLGLLLFVWNFCIKFIIV